MIDWKKPKIEIGWGSRAYIYDEVEIIRDENSLGTYLKHVRRDR